MAGRLSIHLSVTVLYCVKMVQARIITFSPWAALRALVYRDKTVCSWVRGSPRTMASQKGTPSKRRYFVAIDSTGVKTVADRYHNLS